MDESMKTLYEKKIERAVKALNANNMDAHFVQDREELLELVKRLVPKGATVASGGSMTLNETGVYDLLMGGDYDFYYRGRVGGDGKPMDVFRQAFLCDWFFVSSNAITEDGYLYNTDGNANRVAAMAYGPTNVVVIAGANKIVRDLEEAEARMKAIAAPANCIRLEKKTPCTVTGQCMDCRGEDRICCTTVVQGFQRFKNRIKVFLLPEDLGY